MNYWYDASFRYNLADAVMGTSHVDARMSLPEICIASQKTWKYMPLHT